MAIRETLKQAGYVAIKSIGNGEFILTDTEGKQEVWFANKNHASYGITYKNTHLEFARTFRYSYPDQIERENDQADADWISDNVFNRE